MVIRHTSLVSQQQITLGTEADVVHNYYEQYPEALLINDSCVRVGWRSPQVTVYNSNYG